MPTLNESILYGLKYYSFQDSYSISLRTDASNRHYALDDIRSRASIRSASIYRIGSSIKYYPKPVQSCRESSFT